MGREAGVDQLDVIGKGAHLAGLQQRPLDLGPGDGAPPGAETGRAAPAGLGLQNGARQP